MNSKDYYRILDVCEEASAEEIKRAYRRLARKYHPDVSCVDDAEERFKEIVEAYETLRDPCRRSAYDRFGRFAAGQTLFPDWERQFGEIFAGLADCDPDDPADLFGIGRPWAGRGSCGRGDSGSEITAHITVEQAAQGAELELEVPPRALPIDGVQSRRTVRVRIPKGATDGETIRVPGAGHRGATDELPGDLYVTVAVKPHDLFRVTGRDLTLDLPVTPWEAALGATLEVPTLDGRVRLRIPAGTASGQRLRLCGLGLPSRDGGAGDLFVQLKIVNPSVLSERERQLYAELARASSFEPRSHLV